MNTPTLETERLILRKFTEKDMEALFLILKDVETNKFLPWYPVKSIEETEKFYDETEEKRDYPIVIIMNESTASASEVLASALKDSYGAIFVGKISYGKGKVQQTKTLEDGSMVKYTSAKWLRPNGECIDEVGLIPDYDIDLVQNEEGIWIDTQLEKAIELLN